MLQSSAPAPALDWCLFLDVDGTLIELTDTPLHTQVTGDLKALLAEAAAGLDGALALVSGRSIEYLDALFTPLRLPCAGLHGVERRNASGELYGGSFRDTQLDGARAALLALVQGHAGTLLEDKGRTVAIHFRMAPQFEAELRDRVAAIAAGLGASYQLQSGSMMLEIKPCGFNKGGAVRAFLQEPPFSGRTPVYVGDDLTDLDGFKAVGDCGGISIAVGDRIHGQYRLDDPAAVRGWLRRIAGLVDPHRA